MTASNGATPGEFTVKWRYRYSVPPQVVSSELLRINDRDGGVTAQAVVDEARADDSPLHPIFPWDNEVAGEAHRVHLARQLIRSVRIVRPDGGEAPQFVNVRVLADNDAHQRLYRPLVEVLREPDALASAIAFLTSKVAEAQRAVEEVKQAARAVGKEDNPTLTRLGEMMTNARDLATQLTT